MSESITSGQKKQLMRFFEDAIDGLRLSKDDAQCIIERGDEFQSNIVAIVNTINSAQTPARLLELVAAVEIPAVERIVAVEEFTREKGFWLSEEAKKRLLPLVGEAVPAGKIRVNRLTQDSVDCPIKAELGVRAEISIAQFVAALLLGHEVVGDFVIAYLKELPGCTVLAVWHGGRWCLLVFPVSVSHEWRPGGHVLSGDFEPESL